MTVQSAIFYITKILGKSLTVQPLFIQYIMWFGIYQSNFKNDIRLIIFSNIAFLLLLLLPDTDHLQQVEDYDCIC